MKKNAYIVITDLHFDFVKANRINYFGEVLGVLSDLIEIADKYKNLGYTVNQILLGDVFDGSLSNASDAMEAIEIFRCYCSSYATTWSVVGNHEISFATDNPFWFLVSQIEDEQVATLRRYIQPRGLASTIRVVDRIVDGEVEFYFNHYGIRPKVPGAGGVPIGLFHQNVGSNDICKMWGTFENVEEAAFVQSYRYCFFGHMHQAKGKYFLNPEHTCLCEWLGTLGRTKVDEVSDEDLLVNVPAILVEEGRLLAIEDNPVHLKSRDECIDFIKLRASQESTKRIEESKAISSVSYRGESLLSTLESAVRGTDLEYMVSLLNQPFDEVLHLYKEALNEPVVEDTEAH